jgi:hypothetical protein
MNQDLLAAAIIMGIGLIGTVVPLLPGPPLVWLGALYYAYRTNWTEVGWPMLILMLVLALIGSTANTWMSYFGARKGGASLWSSLASIVGGLVGMMVFSLPGAIIGAIGAIALVEYSLHRDWNKVLHAGKGYMVGYLLSMVVEVIVCLAIIGLFVAAVYI